MRKLAALEVKPVRSAVSAAEWQARVAAVVRPYGILEWPALLRQLDERDDSYRS